MSKTVAKGERFYVGKKVFKEGDEIPAKLVTEVPEKKAGKKTSKKETNKPQASEK